MRPRDKVVVGTLTADIHSARSFVESDLIRDGLQGSCTDDDELEQDETPRQRVELEMRD
jgi:hypothetical protein